MIGIVDYGSGNVKAIANIYKQLNIECSIIGDAQSLEKADRLILPGVGSFDETMSELINSGLKEKLNELVLEKKVPVLGICVGMQIMAESSEEGILPGLGWIKGSVKKFDVTKMSDIPFIPHMGWNTITDLRNHPLFEGHQQDLGFYFVHSYYFNCSDQNNALTNTEYCMEFASSVYDKHIFGTQFHPEKSHANGITLLDNFANLKIC